MSAKLDRRGNSFKCAVCGCSTHVVVHAGSVASRPAHISEGGAVSVGTEWRSKNKQLIFATCGACGLPARIPTELLTRILNAQPDAIEDLA